MTDLLSIDGMNVVLGLVFFLALHVIRKSQLRQDFDFAEMLKDDTGKLSVTRLGTMVCLVVSSWVMIYTTTHSKTETVLYFFGMYMGVFSGAKVVERAIDAWRDTKGGTASVSANTDSDQNKP